MTRAEQQTKGNKPAQADAETGGRIATLDLIRGVAVLGILAVNIASFAQPMVSSTTPNLPHPVSATNEAAYATLPQAEQDADFQKYYDFTAEITKRGVNKGGEGCGFPPS